MPIKNIVDLKKELFIRVAGKEEENHTISWELLKKIGNNTQRLIDILSKASVESGLNPEYTKLLFVGFFPGSAVPEWRLQNEPNLLFSVKDEINSLNNDFNFVINSVSEGNFQKIADRYKEPLIRNLVIDAVFDFTNSAGTKPLSIVKRIKSKEIKFRQLAKVRNMTPEQKKILVAKVPEDVMVSPIGSSEAVGKFLISKSAKGKLSRKNVQLYTQKEAALTLRFDSIETNSRLYELKGVVYFDVEEAKNKSCSIENRLLDIYAQGETVEEAEKDMFDQFDFTYKRLNEVEDKKLSQHLLDAKKYINLIVDKIKEK